LGLCLVAGTAYAADAPALIYRVHFLARATTQTSPIRHLLHALGVL
jgi:hypothetical protein